MADHHLEFPLGWLTVTNGQFCETNRVAPRAVPHDGRFDVMLAQGSSRQLNSLRRLAQSGSHTRHRDVQEWLADEMSIESDQTIRVNIDGVRFDCQQIVVRVKRLGISLAI